MLITSVGRKKGGYIQLSGIIQLKLGKPVIKVLDYFV